MSPASPLGLRAYYAIQSNSFSAAVSINDLLKASYLTAGFEIPDLTATYLALHCTVGNAQNLLIGDAKVTTTNFARSIPVSQTTFANSAIYGPFRMSAIPLDSMYVMSANGSTGITIGIEVIPA